MGATAPLDVHMDEADLLRELRSDVATGLAAPQRWLSPRWFYDDIGSQLFDQITQLPEYYLYRAEVEILRDRATDIAAAAGDAMVVELGSGFSTKTQLLLDAMQVAGHLQQIVTVDVSDSALHAAAVELGTRYPGVPLQPIVGDYGRHLGAVPAAPAGARRLLVFLGSTIGNLLPDERAEFLATCAGMLEPDDLFLIGTDLVKDPRTLIAAYDDAAGVTAQFNRNILSVLQRRLGAVVEPDAFAHETTWNADEQWIQIALRATRSTTIDVPDLVTTSLAEGDRILTEISAKFTPERVTSELDVAGFDVAERWLDSQQRFALTLARRR